MTSKAIVSLLVFVGLQSACKDRGKTSSSTSISANSVQAGPLELKAVTLEVESSIDVPLSLEEEWRELAESRLRSELAPGQREGKVQASVEIESRGSRVLAEATMAVLWLDGHGLAPSASATTSIDLTADLQEADAVTAVAAKALLAAAELVGQRERLRNAADKVVIDELNTDDPSRQTWAVIVAASRDLPVAKRLYELLESSYPAVRIAALGGLKQLAPAGAVQEITQRISTEDHLTLSVALEVVAVIGGDDSAAYLRYIATGHGDESIRERAAGLLPENQSD